MKNEMKMEETNGEYGEYPEEPRLPNEMDMVD